MTGSLTGEHNHTNTTTNSVSSSSLATFSPYQSPGRVFSPFGGGGGGVGDLSSPSHQGGSSWSVASPNRLPSIGESFFGNSRVTSPLPPPGISDEPRTQHHLSVNNSTAWSNNARSPTAVSVVTLRNDTVMEGGMPTKLECGNKVCNGHSLLIQSFFASVITLIHCFMIISRNCV